VNNRARCPTLSRASRRTGRRAAITAGPVFRAIGKGDRLTERRLRPAAVAEIIKRRFEAAGLDPDDYFGCA
jgi:hypothetical protein